MSIKKTVSSIFMVPTLGINRDGLLNNQLINGYQWDINRDIKHENSVSLLFKPKNMTKFRDFLNFEYDRTDNVIEDYDYPDGFIVVIYSLNKEFKEDFELIKKGKYSLTSSKFRELFPKTVSIVKKGDDGKNRVEEEESLQWRIFKKTDWMKQYWEDRIAVNFNENMEYWNGWDDSKETLDIEKIKQLI